MMLFINGHNVKLGYVIDVMWTDEEIRNLPYPTDNLPPVRYVKSRDKAFEICKRFNRRFATY